MSPFTSHPDDQLWKFKIKDLFPHDDELARYVLIVLTANEDLSNIEGRKNEGQVLQSYISQYVAIRHRPRLPSLLILQESM